ncbi:MAG: tRNA glutamyl-Q(34) synthetase GluQRS [Bifidobacterium sp.]|nr:tRNA glutamyl-Q(34) synthetase GluQRS [Bifidobacterium sp.]
MTGRLAPTPSGRMHIGNIAAMLAAWLSARAAGERLLLRIEDIDGPRVVPGADRLIMDDLNWLGLDWDGEPIYQSQCLDVYEEAQRALAADGLLYPCFCSRAQIRAASAPQEGDGQVVYPGTCRTLSAEERASRIAAGERHSWRLAVPPPGSPDGEVAFDDRVFGPQRYDLGRDLGDTVLRRSDGLFGYQLAVSVDDALMGVDDIVRGRDLLRSTALQQWLKVKLADNGIGDGTLPAYAHIPLLDDPHGKRLAKRERSTDMGAMRAAGMRPEDVVGVAAWALGLADSERPVPMSAREALAAFSWDKVRRDDVEIDPSMLERRG